MILWDEGIFLLRSGKHCLLQIRRDGFSLGVEPMGVEKSKAYSKVRQMGWIIFHWGFNSGVCLRIPELGLHWGVLPSEYVNSF